jgi:hypothetical protein
MRSVTYLQPGERRSCIGCHEPRGTVPTNKQNLLALKRPPSKIEPGQPVLDRHCVKCHDGKTGDLKSQLVLTGEPAGTFSKSYENLKPYIRWYEWGGSSITQIITRPGRIGADESPLLKVLEDSTHTNHVNLTEAERERLYIWLDGNVPFYGTYDEKQQLEQKNGQAIPLPQIQ